MISLSFLRAFFLASPSVFFMCATLFSSSIPTIIMRKLKKKSALKTKWTFSPEKFTLLMAAFLIPHPDRSLIDHLANRILWKKKWVLPSASRHLIEILLENLSNFAVASLLGIVTLCCLRCWHTPESSPSQPKTVYVWVKLKRYEKKIAKKKKIIINV